MTPAARVAAAIEILTEIERNDAPADTVLVEWFRRHRFAGSGDRRAIRESVYADLRDGALRRWLVANAGGDPESPRLRMIAALSREHPDALDVVFSGDGYAPPLLDDFERAVSDGTAQADAAAAPDHVAANCPAHLYALFAEQWGTQARDELAAMNRTAPVDLRVNTLNADRADARARLAADGYKADVTPFSPSGLRSHARGDFRQLGAFRAGMIEPQDESSQLVSMLVDAAPGQNVVDYCAGAGGKALALAAATNNQAEILACDVSRLRLDRIAGRAARLGVTSVAIREVPADAAPTDLVGRADRVLIDAPCSGTGTWRRSPDLRWRTRPGTVADYQDMQDGLLDSAAGLVKPGGRIVYAVCSVLEGEGRSRVDAFLARHPRFARRLVGDVLGTDLAARLDLSDDLVLTPHRHGTDGMYAAVLVRTD